MTTTWALARARFAVAGFLLAVPLLQGFGGCSGGAGGPKPASGMTCQDIRACIWYCASDVSQPCVNDCIARGTAEARTTFAALAACTAPHCPTGDSYCGCEQRCFGEGNCLDETAACAGGATDLVCDQFCH